MLTTSPTKAATAVSSVVGKSALQSLSVVAGPVAAVVTAATSAIQAADGGVERADSAANRYETNKDMVITQGTEQKSCQALDSDNDVSVLVDSVEKLKMLEAGSTAIEREKTAHSGMHAQHLEDGTQTIVTAETELSNGQTVANSGGAGDKREGRLYEVRPSMGKGLGCFALQDIQCGTRLLAEAPLLTYPHARCYVAEIEAAFEKLSPEAKEKFFELASNHGQDPGDWPSSISPYVHPAERKRIEEQHNSRIAKDASIFSIFTTNCMSWNNGCAVYYKASRFNHSCLPNAVFAWNARLEKETIHACRDIKEGEEIALCYCDPFHETAMRQWELKHYGFKCDCPACGDTSNPASFATGSVQRRYRLREICDSTPGNRHVFGPEEANPSRLKDCLETAALLCEEGLRTVELGHTYFDIAYICEANGDYLSAYRAAIEGFKVHLDCLGGDAPTVELDLMSMHRIKFKLQEAKKPS